MKTSEEIIAEIKQLLKENKERSWVNDSSKVYGEDWHKTPSLKKIKKLKKAKK